MKKSQLFWQTYLNIENEVLELSKIVYISDAPTSISKASHQLETYSPYIADLLIKCCVEIEAISKELYFDNGGTKSRGSKDLYFDTDCIDLIYQKWNLDRKVVIIVASNFNLTKDENRILTPLRNAHKPSKVYWAKAYQAVKHNRYDYLYYGNIKALLQALAALYLLNVYYRDVKLFSKYKDYKQLDMSLGSKIFTLKTPNEAPQIWYGNKSKAIDSPYVVNYTNASYDKIIKMQQKDNEAINNYWKAQPELNEPLFIKQMLEAKAKEEKDPAQRVMHLWELSKYRINKKVPQGLPFEERKKLFCQCSERKSRIYLINKHLTDDEITEENIDEEITHAGICQGISLMQSLMTHWEVYSFTDAECEIVIDK